MRVAGSEVLHACGISADVDGGSDFDSSGQSLEDGLVRGSRSVREIHLLGIERHLVDGSSGVSGQGIDFANGRFVYRFLDRRPGEPMAADPTVQNTIVVEFDPATDRISAVS